MLHAISQLFSAPHRLNLFILAAAVVVTVFTLPFVGGSND